MSIQASTLLEPVLRAAFVIDTGLLLDEIRAALATDHDILSKLDLPRWTKDDTGLIRCDGRIYVPDTGDLRLRVLRMKHDHPTAGHFGQNKTLALIRREFTWPNLRSMVNDYVRSCTSCAWSKAPRHKPYGTLQQLPVPDKPWNSISMDFIEHLPPSSGFTAILVVVDRFSKQSIFIPTYDTINSADLAVLFVQHVFSKHGVPSHVTSDCGSEFVSQFFRSLGKALNMTLHFTSGYHPEADGQTERVNQTLEQYLRHYCSYQQDDWSQLLPLAEFAYNNAPSETTGISPFFANKGYNPNLEVHPERDLASAAARDYVVNLDELHNELKQSILAAQKRYQGPADRRRQTPPDFPVGTQVYVHAKFFRTTRPSKKLSEKNLGPFEVTGKVGPQSYRIQLPSAFRTVHPVFHVSQLEQAHPNVLPGRVQPPPPPVEVDGEEEYEIDEIVDSVLRKIQGGRTKLYYKIKWLGYEGTPEEYQWIVATDLEHAQEAVADFHARYPDKPKP